MQKLALFDIDRTLVTPSKAHREVFHEAFRRVYGVETTIDIIRHHGMTDQQIIIDVLTQNGLSEQEIVSKMEEAEKVMIDLFNQFIQKDDVMPLDGIPELLKELDRRGIFMGLVTGNLEPIGWGKLRKIGLDGYFKIGGFGSDDRSRTNLVKLAIKKAEEEFGFSRDRNVFLFGDTPDDIKAGREAGIKTIAVATGTYSKQQLEECGADVVLDDLKDTHRVLGIVL